MTNVLWSMYNFQSQHTTIVYLYVWHGRSLMKPKAHQSNGKVQYPAGGSINDPFRFRSNRFNNIIEPVNVHVISEHLVTSGKIIDFPTMCSPVMRWAEYNWNGVVWMTLRIIIPIFCSQYGYMYMNIIKLHDGSASTHWMMRLNALSLDPAMSVRHKVD